MTTEVDTVSAPLGVRDMIASLIADVPDWPQPGVVFKDITPLLASPGGFSAAITELVSISPREVDLVIGMEARGFIFAAPVALALGAGFAPVRKPGKLPRVADTEMFDLEYGQAELSLPLHSVRPGMRVLIVDDVLATGGTLGATAALVRRAGAEVVGVSVLLELGFLGGRAALAGRVDEISAVVATA